MGAHLKATPWGFVMCHTIAVGIEDRVARWVGIRPLLGWGLVSGGSSDTAGLGEDEVCQGKDEEKKTHAACEGMKTPTPGPRKDRPDWNPGCSTSAGDGDLMLWRCGPTAPAEGTAFLWASPVLPEGTAKLTWGQVESSGLGTQVRRSARRGQESGQDVGGGG